MYVFFSALLAKISAIFFGQSIQPNEMTVLVRCQWSRSFVCNFTYRCSLKIQCIIYACALKDTYVRTHLHTTILNFPCRCAIRAVCAYARWFFLLLINFFLSFSLCYIYTQNLIYILFIRF